MAFTKEVRDRANSLTPAQKVKAKKHLAGQLGFAKALVAKEKASMKNEKGFGGKRKKPTTKTQRVAKARTARKGIKK